MMKKRSLFKESFYTTAFILLSLFGLSRININSDVVNPISKAMSDFQLTDIVFSQLKDSPELDTNIVMVNLGPAWRDRSDHARIINILNHYEPKIIAIDAFFKKPRRDSTIDSSLAQAFSRVKNLVLVCQTMRTIHPM